MVPVRAMIDRLAAELSDWMFLTSGLTLLALALITPTWLACRDLAFQRDLMAMQLERFESQHGRYRNFHAALQQDDPILLERLAFTQLGLKPSGKQVLALPDLTAYGMGKAAVIGVGQTLDPAVAYHPDVLATSASIDTWLLAPMPRLGIDLTPPKTVNTRLMRITTTPTLRVALLAAAIACVAAGLWPNREELRQSEALPQMV